MWWILLDQTYHKMEVLLINDGSLNQHRVNYDELIKRIVGSKYSIRKMGALAMH